MYHGCDVLGDAVKEGCLVYGRNIVYAMFSDNMMKELVEDFGDGGVALSSQMSKSIWSGYDVVV